MRTLTLSTLLLIACLSCNAQNPPKLTADQKVALYQSRDKVNAALDRLKATPEWAELQKVQQEQQAALATALKGIDEKKWKLGNDLEFTAVPTPEAKPTSAVTHGNNSPAVTGDGNSVTVK